MQSPARLSCPFLAASVLKIVELLLGMGADMSHKDSSGKSAIDYAKAYQDAELENLLQMDQNRVVVCQKAPISFSVSEKNSVAQRVYQHRI